TITATNWDQAKKGNWRSTSKIHRCSGTVDITMNLKRRKKSFQKINVIISRETRRAVTKTGCSSSQAVKMTSSSAPVTASGRSKWKARSWNTKRWRRRLSSVYRMNNAASSSKRTSFYVQDMNRATIWQKN